MGLITKAENAFSFILRRYHWWYTPLLLIAFFIFCGGLAWWFQGIQLQRRFEAMQAAGQPVTLEDLNDFYRLPDDMEDNTELWKHALELVAQTESHPDAKTLPVIGDGPEIPPFHQSWPEQDTVAAFLEQHADTLAAIHAAAEAGGGVRFPRDFSEGYNMLLPEMQVARDCARLLTLEAHTRAQEGDIAGAVESIRHTFASARTMENEPILVSYLVKLAIDEIAVENAVELLPQIEPTADQLRVIQKELRRTDYRSGLERAMLGERAIAMLMLDDPATVEVPISNSSLYVPFTQSAKATHLDLTNDAIDATQEPWHESTAPERFDSDWKPRRWNPGDTIASLLGYPAKPCFQAGANQTAKANCLDVAIAAELFRREHGSFPQQTEELVPEFLSAVPADPFDGKPLRYQVESEGIVVYSVGRDRVDGHGAIDLDPNTSDYLDVGVRWTTAPDQEQAVTADDES